MRKDNSERNARIIQDRLSGMDHRSIGEKYGLTGARISQICLDAGLDYQRVDARRLDHTNRNAVIIQQRLRRMKLKDIAASHGVSVSTVEKVCLEAGLRGIYVHEGRKSGPRYKTNIRNQEITRMCRYHTQAEVARMFGLDQSRISAIKRSETAYWERENRKHADDYDGPVVEDLSAVIATGLVPMNAESVAVAS